MISKGFGISSSESASELESESELDLYGSGGGAEVSAQVCCSRGGASGMSSSRSSGTIGLCWDTAGNPKLANGEVSTDGPAMDPKAWASLEADRSTGDLG